MGLLSFEDGLGIAAPEAGKPAASSGKALMSFEDGLGIPPPTETASLGGFLRSPESWKRMVGDVDKYSGSKDARRLAFAVADMIAGVPGQVMAVAADMGVRTLGVLKGESRAVQDAAALEAQQMIPESLQAPLQTLNKYLTGAEPWDQSAVDHLITKGTDALEKASKGAITSGGAKSILNAFMAFGGAKAGDVMVKMALENPKLQYAGAKEKPAAEEAPPTEAPAPKRPGPEVVVMEKKAQVKKLFADAKRETSPLNVPDAAAVSDMFDRVRRGDPAPDAGMERAVPAKPPVIPPAIEPLAKTRLQDPTIIGQERTSLETAQEKLIAGKGFELAAEEVLALKKAGQARQPLVDQYGKPLALGALAMGALAGLDLSDEERAGLGLGIGMTMGPKGQRGGEIPLGWSAGDLHPYAFPSLDSIAKGATEVAKSKIEARLKNEAIPEAERAIIKRVLATEPGDTISTRALVNGVREETSGFKLEPKQVDTYADYGLANIREPADFNAKTWDNIPAAKTTLYKLPERSAASDANHFGEPDLFGWTRSFREEGKRHVVELQSDLAQHAKEVSPEKLAATLKAAESVGKQLKILDDHIGERVGVKSLPQIIEQLDKLNPDASIIFADKIATSEFGHSILKTVKSAGSPLEYIKYIVDVAQGKIDGLYPAKGRASEALAQAVMDSKNKLAMLQHEHAVTLQGGAVSSQLSPVLKNWPRRLIREELRQEALAGGNSVRFATADTVAKVEGWPRQTLERIKDRETYQQGMEMPADAGVVLETAAMRKAVEAGGGFHDPGHQSIYDRYAGPITRYLKGLGGKEVVDGEGHTWIEVPTKGVLHDTPKGPAIKMLGSADQKVMAVMAAAGVGGAVAAADPGLGLGLAAAGLGIIGTGRLKGKNLIDTFRAGNAPDAPRVAKLERDLAASQLYEANAPVLKRALRSYESKGLDIEELVQRTLMKGFASLDKPADAPGGFRGDSKFSSFLFGNAQNLAKDAWRAGERGLKTEDLTPELIDRAYGHSATPEKAALNKALTAKLVAAIERLPDKLREPFELAELEGLTDIEIGQRLGIDRAAARKAIYNARQELRQSLRAYADGESGFADPKMLAGIAAIGGGAVTGAWLDDSQPLRGSIYGALTGLALGTTSGRTLLKEVIKSPDGTLGAISTRLGNVDPSLKLAIRRHEKRVLQNLDRVNDQILPFIQALDALPGEAAARASRALMNNDLETVNAIPELRSAYPAVATALGKIKGELQGLNRFGEGVVDYFPRLVKDLEGLKKHLGSIYSEGIEKALLTAEANMIRKEGRSLTDVEQSLVVNRFLFASDRSAFQPGYAKGRKIEEITPDLQKFYEPPTESLLRYISGALNDVQAAKFFGKDLAVRKQGGKNYNDIDSSIGNLTARLQQEGKLTREQGIELRDILKARFEGGDKGMSTVLAHTRNLTNTALLGNVASAATQLGDSLLTVYHHGAVPTIQAVAQRLLGRQKITAKQLGLINHVAEELAGQGTTGAVLQKTLKYSGFMAIDMFAKGLNLNAGLIKNTKLAETAAGQQVLWDRYGRAFGDDMPQLIEDLKARRMSDNVETLAFSELSDAQPISKAEMPEAYLRHPNGRILYQLKTYMLKQVDIVRRDVYQNIASGEPRRIMEGSKNLAALAAIYALANVPGDVVKDLLSGRDVDPFTTPQLVDNVLQTFGLNRYTQDSLSKGKVVETAQNLVTPPLKVFQDLGKTVNSMLEGGSNYKGASYVPIAGRPVYERFLGGNERKEIAEKRLENLKLPKEERKTLSPAAKDYLQNKRLERDLAKVRASPSDYAAEKKLRATQARIDKREASK